MKSFLCEDSMELTNYWWLLIWPFLGGAIFSNMPKRRELVAGKMVERWQPLYAFLLLVPFIVWAGYRGWVGDTAAYRNGFLNASANLLQIPGLFAARVKDPGYDALVIVLKLFLGNQDKVFFLLIAAFQMICMMMVFRKYSDNYWICILLFVASGGYMAWMMNGMRQFIAVTAIFACFDWMVQKKYIPLIIAILLASTIHQSALIMIPIVFMVQGEAWNIKTIFMLGITAAIMMFTDRFLPILEDLLQNTQYDNAVNNMTDDGTNAIRVLVASVPTLLSLFGLKYIRHANSRVINLCVNYSIFTMAISLISMVTSGIYIGRLPIYTTLYGYVVLPWMINRIFERRSAQFVTYAMIVMYCLFFYYQMGVAWNYL